MADTKQRRETRYTIRLMATAANIKQMRNKILALDPNASVQIAKVERDPSRADRLQDALALAADALSEVESLHEEVEAWKESLPENLQDGDKASQLDECMEALDRVKEALEEAESASGEVSFPGMY